MIRLTTIFLLLLLAGCSTQGVTPSLPNLSIEQRLPLASDLKDWRLEGKISLRQADQRHSASMIWTQNADKYQVSLSGPLGQAIATLDGQPRFAQVQLSNGEIYQDENPDKLLSELLNWPLPVGALYWWIRGIPSPTAPYTLLSAAPEKISQLGWEVSFSSFQTTVNWLPKKIRLKQPPFEAVIVLHNWDTSVR